MPFSTAFLSEYSGTHLRLPLAFYTVNIGLTGLSSYRLWSFIGLPEQKLSTGLDSVVVSYNRVKALAVPLVFVALFFISFVNLKIAYLFSLATIPVSRMINGYYMKKHPAVMKEHFE